MSGYPNLNNHNNAYQQENLDTNNSRNSGVF